jgi:mannose-1-phosphate guanylyltransferase
VIIPEPLAKNTAPAIICGTRYAVLTSGEDRTILVLTSDHIIRPMPAFLTDAGAAAAGAEEGFLVVFGIPPKSPATGYGYIECGEGLSLPKGTGESSGPSRLYRVRSFREKPDRETAGAFLAAGRF